MIKRCIGISILILLVISCAASAEEFSERAKRADELYKAGDYKGVVAYLSDITVGEIPNDYRTMRTQYYESHLRVAQALIKAGTPLEAYPYLLAAEKYPKAKEILDKYMYRMLGTWETAKGERYAFFIDGSCIIQNELLFFSAPSSRIMISNSRGSSMRNRYTFLNSTDKMLRLRVVATNDVLLLTRVKAAEYSPSEEDLANLKPAETAPAATAPAATKAPALEPEVGLEDEDWVDEDWVGEDDLGDDYGDDYDYNYGDNEIIDAYPGMFDDEGEGIDATLNQRMPTRSGPDTKFTEDHGTMPDDTEIIAFEQETTGGTSWVLVEFVKNGKLVRAYTGLKRIDANEPIPQADDDPKAAIVTQETSANYGPGTAYLAVPTPVPAGTEVLVYRVEKGYALIEYASGDQWMRSWVPESAIEYTGTDETSETSETSPEEQDASGYTRKVTIINNTTVNIRSGPGTDYPQIGEAFPGANFYYTGVEQGDFYEILYPDISNTAGLARDGDSDSEEFSRKAYVKKNLTHVSQINSQDVILSTVAGNLMIKQGTKVYLDANLSRVLKNAIDDYSTIPFAGTAQSGAYAVLFNRTNDNGEAVLWIGYISADDVETD